jgi:tetratricopeptide (TPR) repeat protein
MSKIRKSRGNKPGSANPEVTISPLRLWIFKVSAAILIPAFILGLLELGLRAGGYGYSTRFFETSKIGGKNFLIPNYKFSYRFFPPALARKPTLTRYPARKEAGVYRIFVFGESAALGDPEPTYGVSRYLDVLLEGRYPDTEFEVICVAMTAINSHVVLPIVKECAGLEGDLWLIYMGNNEMVGPFGASTVFGAKAPGLRFIRTSLALKKARLGQLMARAASRLGSSSQAPDQWGGINMFKQNPLRYNDPARLRAYENFEGNLLDILKNGQAAGVPIIVSTVAGNLKDCSPFSSLHREGLSASEKSEWDLLFEEGSALEKTGQYEAALRYYREAAAIDAEYAELKFRTGSCLLALGRTEDARQAFEQARDYDALAVRADTRINRILMDATLDGNDHVFGVDAAEILSDLSSEGITGKELFYEHVHFTVEGNYTLARLFADQVSTLLPPEILESQMDHWLEQKACSRRLGLTVWDQARLWHEESKRISTMPFTGQTSNPDNRHYIHGKKSSAMARITKDTRAQDLQLYQSALAQSPDDTQLIGNYAQFLDAMGMTGQAIQQAERFCTLLPSAWTEYYKAALLAKAGRLNEAEACLGRAMEMNSDIPQVHRLLEQIRKVQYGRRNPLIR